MIKMHIYRTTHITTGKMYIGKETNPTPTYFGSGRLIKEIIKEEGKVNLIKEILEIVDDKEDLATREKYWLEKFDARNNPNYLNLTNKPFGNSGMPQEARDKISKAHKGKPKSQQMKDRLSKSKMGKKKIHPNVRCDAGIKRGKNPKISKALKGVPKVWNYKPVLQLTLEGELIKEYASAKEAKQQTGIKIQNAIVGKMKTSGGFLWRYK